MCYNYIRIGYMVTVKLVNTTYIKMKSLFSVQSSLHGSHYHLLYCLTMYKNLHACYCWTISSWCYIYYVQTYFEIWNWKCRAYICRIVSSNWAGSFTCFFQNSHQKISGIVYSCSGTDRLAALNLRPELQ